MIVGQSWTVDKLKAKCGELGLKKTGKKQDLIDRINTHVMSVNTEPCTSSIDDLTAGLQNVRLKKSWENMTVSELKTELDTFRLPTNGCKEDLLKRLQSYFYPKDDFDLRKLNKDRIKVLFVAEKPSMAKELARTLAPRSYYRDKSENSRKINETSKKTGDSIVILEFSSYFKGLPADFVVTSTFGHIFNEEFQGQHGGRKEEIQELFERKVISVPNTGFLEKKLGEVSRGCDVVVLWLDCDLEGEAICYEVLECIKDSINTPPTGDIMDVVFRAKFSAAEDAPKAINNLIKPNFLQNLANIAKHDLDLRIGVVFSRFQTAVLRSQLRNLDIPHVSFGPCQTPCLAFCVERYHKTINYKAVVKYQVVVDLSLNGKKIKVTSRGFETRGEAEKIANSLQNQKNCKIVSVKRTDFSKDPPAGLNTIHLLQECSKIHGFSPDETMNVAERLYSTGLISYPRTETTRYPEDLRASERVLAIKENIGLADESMDWENYVTSEKVVERGIDVGDHQPILPTTVIHKRSTYMNERQTKVYDLISRHFLASFLGPHKYHILDVVFDLGNELTFNRKIQIIDDEGFTSLLPWEKVETTDGGDFGKEGSLPNVVSIKIKEDRSQPPSLITESELIGLMEKHRIGTDGSIPGHIGNILKRKYVTLEKESRCLKPTELGLQLYNAYHQCVPELLNPTLRATVEALLMEIANGKRDFEEVRRYILDQFKLQYKNFVENFEKFAPDFKDCFELKDACYVTRKEDRVFAKPHQPRNRMMYQSRDSNQNPLMLEEKKSTSKKRTHDHDPDFRYMNPAVPAKRREKR
ncbi:hypothetical protein FO519_008869 [Halicephalobus sp. NKZ332]|nr:hypothetical protein FO519_008869 [Halicephalobus sp. NKZ332]